ncbi:MAG TPA: alpha-L-fucosidase C-terminal domain-containing protein, partial [Opitutales bacterium]|nr:alpha-L-fucosidase C-terminal domain-containing protein [Opitutales bacterium]
YNEAEGIYYTAKQNRVYAICTEWPGDLIFLEAFSETNAPGLEIKSVQLLGSDEKVAWEHTENGLKLSIPEQAPNELGLVYRIVTK